MAGKEILSFCGGLLVGCCLPLLGTLYGVLTFSFLTWFPVDYGRFFLFVLLAAVVGFFQGILISKRRHGGFGSPFVFIGVLGSLGSIIPLAIFRFAPVWIIFGT